MREMVAVCKPNGHLVPIKFHVPFTHSSELGAHQAYLFIYF